MKLTTLLERQSLSYKDLTHVQLSTLKKFASGALNIDNATESQMRSIYELVSLGLVDESFELTREGMKMYRISQKFDGVSYEQMRAKKGQQISRTNDIAHAAHKDRADDYGIEGRDSDIADDFDTEV